MELDVRNIDRSYLVHGPGGLRLAARPISPLAGILGSKLEVIGERGVQLAAIERRSWGIPLSCKLDFEGDVRYVLEPVSRWRGEYRCKSTAKGFRLVAHSTMRWSVFGGSTQVAQFLRDPFRNPNLDRYWILASNDVSAFLVSALCIACDMWTSLSRLAMRWNPAGSRYDATWKPDESRPPDLGPPAA